MKKEIGRLLLNNITLIEYGGTSVRPNFFVQCGVAGFYASEDELNDLFYALNYYKHIDGYNDIVISTLETEESI